ncbi:MAG: hypothetical protein M1376_10845 [Planctomycetes bacterium]|nr:hypothetical protein [Planctomycetota bacterium]
MMLTATQEQMRHSESEMRNALQRAKPHSKMTGHSATCPNPQHDDKSPSGSIKVGEDGAVRFTCHACGWHGDIFDVIAVSTGRSLEDVLADHRDQSGNSPARPPAANPAQKPARTFASYEALRAIRDAEAQHRFNATFEAAHFYENPDTGRADLLVLRYRKPPESARTKGKKDMPQFYQRPDGVFVEGKPAGKARLYRRKENRGAKTIIIVEGEAKVDALLAMGFNATCWPGGASAVEQADFGPLDGVERTVFWPDNDTPGRTAMKTAADLVSHLPNPPESAWIEPTGLDLEETEDVVDLIAQCRRVGSDPKQVIAEAIQNARSSNLSEGLRERFDQIIAGTWYSLAFPFVLLSKLSKALLPQNVCIIAGRAGAVKSFILLWTLLHWFLEGVRFAYLGLEEDRTFLNWRLVAILEKNGRLLDDEWVKAHADEARAAYERQKHILDRFGRSVWEKPGEQVDLPWVADWIRGRARDGYRVIVADPITVCRPSFKPYIADHEFVSSVEFTVSTCNASVLLVTHCGKGSLALDMDSIAGGAAYQRLCQCLLLLERHKPPKEVTMINPEIDVGRFSCKIDETIHICKSRKGKGTGLSIGCKIDWDRMEFAEQGVIVRKQGKNSKPQADTGNESSEGASTEGGSL